MNVTIEVSAKEADRLGEIIARVPHYGQGDQWLFTQQLVRRLWDSMTGVQS